MLKRLMTTTAIVAIATSAYAAGPANQNDNSGAMNPPAIHFAAGANIDSSDMLATNLIGQSVYSGVPNQAMMPKTGANAQAQNDKVKDGNRPAADTAAGAAKHDTIGNINNLVVAKDGSVDAVIIGVGGFLGMGEKNVAVPFDSLRWSVDANGKPLAYLSTTKDELKNAPELRRLDAPAECQRPESVGNGRPDRAEQPDGH